MRSPIHTVEFTEADDANSRASKAAKNEHCSPCWIPCGEQTEERKRSVPGLEDPNNMKSLERNGGDVCLLPVLTSFDRRKKNPEYNVPCACLGTSKTHCQINPSCRKDWRIERHRSVPSPSRICDVRAIVVGWKYRDCR